MYTIILMGSGSINSLLFCRIAFCKEQLNGHNTVVKIKDWNAIRIHKHLNAKNNY